MLEKVAQWWKRLAHGSSLAAALLIAATLAGGACGPQSSPPPAAPGATDATAETPKYGGVFRQSAGSDPPHLDPHDTLAAALHGSSGPAAVYSRLIRYEYRADLPQGSKIPYPDLAESWKQENDTTFVFTLRKGVKWQNIPPVNGRELVADDVVFSYKRQTEPGRPNTQQFASVASMTAPDKYTIKIVLKAPDADFLIDLADGRNKVVAPEAVALKGDLKAGPTIGTGPWILEKFEKGVGVSFVRNPEYFEKDLPYLDRREVFTGLGDAATQLSAFRTKQIDILGVDPQQEASMVKSNPEVKVFKTGSVGGTPQQLALKQDRAPFNNLKVRQAISKAIDRQQIIDAAWSGTGFFGMGINLTSPDWALPDAELKQHYQRDVEGAKRLLAEAGYPNGLDMDILVGPLSQEYVTTAELVVPQLKEANIRAKLEVIDYPRWAVQALAQGNFPSAALGTISQLSTTNASLYGLMYSGSVRNINAVKDPTLDKMIDAQRGALDPAKRKQLVQDILRYILQNEYQNVLRLTQTTTLAWPYVKNHLVGISGTGAPESVAYYWIDGR